MMNLKDGEVIIAKETVDTSIKLTLENLLTAMDIINSNDYTTISELFSDSNKISIADDNLINKTIELLSSLLDINFDMHSIKNGLDSSVYSGFSIVEIENDEPETSTKQILVGTLAGIRLLTLS